MSKGHSNSQKPRNKKLKYSREEVEANGVPYHNYVQRVYQGMDEDEASTRPVRKHKKLKYSRKEVEARGIPFQTYIQRVNRGMDEDEAIEKPIKKGRSLTPKQYSIAKENGISDDLITRRLRYSKWKIKEVINVPPGEKLASYRKKNNDNSLEDK
ncbi:hypothetical protein MTR05_12705 [Staphylococcus agnetis]|uniref:hypothetical protein n=1 Tax=Staphylococcus agnetis TaxID=985762 RepID=UPI00208EA063|nr:hypothetical protein [Staphylococcus agnetis]MCO4327874.1 hypothetical protein [Staphylococcus agnetis]